MSLPSLRAARRAALLSAALSLPLWPGEARAQADLGETGDLLVDLPDLTRLLRARPPMGECPLGDIDQADAPPPGSHLLHLGVPRFYQDYRRRLGLSAEQLQRLGEAQAAALQTWSQLQEDIDRQEQALWTLTGDPDVDLAQVEAAVRALEQRRADQRFAYIQATHAASQLLTPEQRAALIGVPLDPQPQADH